MNKRVVITGLGVVSSIGIGKNEFSSSLKRGESGISRISSFDTKGFPYYYAGEIKSFEPEKWVKHMDSDSIGRSSQFVIASAKLAIEDADIELESINSKRCGVCIGTTDGESSIIEKLNKEWVNAGPEHLSGELICQIPPHQISLSVAKELGICGEVLTISTACAAGNYALGHAYDLIRTGKSDFMFCGGVDSLSRKTFAGFFRLGTIAPFACQPFDKNRHGLLTGEGCGILFLETLESAQKRGAHIYAEILGYGLSCDATHMTSPNEEGIISAIKNAHQNSGIQPGDVDYISAHGTGTKVNDITEVNALKKIFNGTLPYISSIKSMLGHTMGAASALALISSCIAMDEQFIPPTINVSEVDPEIGVNCVPNDSIKCQLNIVQNNAFAFGGNNAIVILGRI